MNKSLSLVAVLLAITPAALLARVTGSNYTVQTQYALGGNGKWDYLTMDAAAHRL